MIYASNHRRSVSKLRQLRRTAAAGMVVALAGWPGSAQAGDAAEPTDPACVARPSLRIAVDPEVAIGRPVRVRVTESFADFRSSLGSRVQVRVGNRVRWIQRGVVGVEPEVALDLGPAPKARRLRVQASWLDRVQAADPLDDDVLCARSVSVIVRIVPGRVPTLRRALEPIGPGTFAWELPVVLDDDCSVIFAAGPLVVEIGRRRLLWRRDVCEESGRRRTVTGRAWRLEVLGGIGNAELSFDSAGPARQSLPYTIRVGRAIVERGTVAVRREQRAGRTIFEGTDDFINVCINELLTIRSSGGKLYCSIPAQTRFHVTRRGR